MHVFTAPVLIALSALLLLVVVSICARFLLSRPASPIAAITYEALPSLLTPAEHVFFAALRQAVRSEFLIFVKVRLADIVKPTANPSRSGWQSAFNRIACKHVDFVLCDFSTLAVCAVVELDDRTHERHERAIRDRLVDSALTNAHIPVLRIAARQSYSPAQIREQLTNLLNNSVETSRPSG